MSSPEEKKPKRPWGGFGYLILVIIVILVGYFLVLPIGQQVRATFQKLDDALAGKR